jgi:glycogen(starch) synthase
MTRIVLVASSFLPRIGGVEEHVWHVSRELTALGHDVRIWAVDQGDDGPAEVHGVPVTYLPTPLPSGSARGVGRWLRSAPGAAAAWIRAYRRDRPELLDIQCFGPNGTYALALAAATRTPLVYSNHGETFMDAHGVFERSAIQRLALRLTLRHARAVTSCSAYAAADLGRGTGRGRPRGRILRLIPNAVDTDAGGDPIEIDLPPRYFAGIGRLVDNKGFATLIEAFARAAENPALEGVSLVIAGDGPEKSRLERLVADRGLSERVHLIGALPRRQVVTLLGRATALAVPSTVEAFGIVILEGWRAGIPVLATNRGGPPEFVRDGDDGLLFDPGDASALARLLVEVAADPDRSARLGGAGHARLPEYTWSRVARDYSAVFAEVRSRPRSLPRRLPFRARRLSR